MGGEANGDDPGDMTAEALALSLGSDEISYRHKLPTVHRMRAKGFSDVEIETALVIKLKPQDRQEQPVSDNEADGPKRFRVLDGGESPRPYAKHHKDDFEQLLCRVCEKDIGVASSVFIEVHQAPHEQKGEIIRSTKGLICVYCLSRGKVTRMM